MDVEDVGDTADEEEEEDEGDANEYLLRGFVLSGWVGEDGGCGPAVDGNSDGDTWPVLDDEEGMKRSLNDLRLCLCGDCVVVVVSSYGLSQSALRDDSAGASFEAADEDQLAARLREVFEGDLSKDLRRSLCLSSCSFSATNAGGVDLARVEVEVEVDALAVDEDALRPFDAGTGGRVARLLA